MTFHGNILWLILGGIVIAVIYYIIGLPHFKMAVATLFPFEKEIH